MPLNLAMSWERLRARLEKPAGSRRVRRTNVTALDVEGRRLHVVQAALRGGQARVIQHATLELELPTDLPADDPVRLGQAIAAALRRAAITPGPVVVGVPRSQALLRTLDLPHTDREPEIASMVHLRLSRDLPFPLDEALIDFKRPDPPPAHEPGRGRPRPRDLRFMATEQVRKDQNASPEPGLDTTTRSGVGRARLLPSQVTRETDGTPEPARPSKSVATLDADPSRGISAPPPSTRVLTAVVRRKTVDDCQSLVKAAGLKLAAVGLRPLASAHAALGCHPDAAAGCLALVTIQAQEIAFDVLVEGALVFSRVGTLPAVSDPAPRTGDAGPDPGLAAILTEVVRSLHGYEASPGQAPVTRFLVTGSTGREAVVAEALGRQLAVTAGLLDIPQRWGETAAPTNEPQAGGARLLPSRDEEDDGAARREPRPTAFTDPTRAHRPRGQTPPSPPPSLAAIGLALSALEPAGFPFDFLHPKRPPVAHDNRRTRQLAIVAGILALLLTAAGLRARWIGGRERVRADLQEQVNLGAKNLAAYRLVRNQARTLKDWSASSRNWLDHLTLLSALLPPSQELYVTALSTSARNTLNLAVKIRSGETVDRLTATLRSAGYDVKAPAIMPATDRFGFRFQANLELVVPSAITNDLDALVVEARASAPISPATAPAPAPSPAPPSAAAPTAPGPPPTTAVAPQVEPGGTETPSRPARNWRRRAEGGGRE